METKETNYIFKDIASTMGGDSSSKVYTVTTIHTGETQIVIEKTISKRLPIQEYNEAMQMYERLNGSGRIITLEDLIEIRNK